MNKGDIVRHKLADEVYRILKMGEGIAICQCAPHSHKLGWSWQIWESYICSLDNLEPYPEGKFIFDWIDSFDETYFNNRWKKLMKVSEAKPGTQLSLI
jgi:hypothetical protein